MTKDEALRAIVKIGDEFAAGTSRGARSGVPALDILDAATIARAALEGDTMTDSATDDEIEAFCKAHPKLVNRFRRFHIEYTIVEARILIDRLQARIEQLERRVLK